MCKSGHNWIFKSFGTLAVANQTKLPWSNKSRLLQCFVWLKQFPPVLFTLKVSGLPTPDLSWQLNGRPIRPDSSHKMLVRENGVHSLIIEPVTSRDAGIYTCIASNRAGENSFSLELIVAGKSSCSAFRLSTARRAGKKETWVMSNDTLRGGG